jgi:hypothetical protein
MSFTGTVYPHLWFHEFKSSKNGQVYVGTPDAAFICYQKDFAGLMSSDETKVKLYTSLTTYETALKEGKAKWNF